MSNAKTLAGTVSTGGVLATGDVDASKITGTTPVANGGTGATTLTANNVILGNGTSAVQVVAPGASGNVLTSNGTTWQSTALQAGITNVVTATSSTTLTSTPTLLKFAPTEACQKIKLPDATTMNMGANVFVIEMDGGYPAIIVDNGGNILAWTKNKSDSTVVVHLIDNTTTNGAWGFENVDYCGLEVNEVVNFPNRISTASSVIYTFSAELDSDRTLILTSGTQLYAVVYNKSTDSFGSVVLVRNAATTSTFIAGVISSSSVLVVSALNPNNLEGVVLSISGTTITVNTAATLTLSGGAHLSVNNGYRNLVSAGTSWAYLCNSSSAGAVVPIDVSGTTVTFGTPVATTGTNIHAVYNVSSSVVLVFCSNGTNTIYAECFTISGSTATKNSNVSCAASNATDYIIEKLDSRWVVASVQTNNLYADLISVTGTTPSTSRIALIAGTALNPSYFYSHKIGNQVIVGIAQTSGNYIRINVLTDNAGTAVAGSQINISGAAASVLQYYGGNDTESWWENRYSATDHYGFKITISGNDPVMTMLYRTNFSSTNFYVPIPSGYKIGTPFSGPNMLWSNSRTIYPNTSAANNSTPASYANGIIRFEDNSGTTVVSGARVSSNSEIWACNMTEWSPSGASTQYFIQKVRVV